MKLARMRQVYGIPAYDHVYGPSYPSPSVMRNKVSISLSNVKIPNSHLVIGMRSDQYDFDVVCNAQDCQ